MSQAGIFTNITNLTVIAVYSIVASAHTNTKSNLSYRHLRGCEVILIFVYIVLLYAVCLYTTCNEIREVVIKGTVSQVRKYKIVTPIISKMINISKGKKA